MSSQTAITPFTGPMYADGVVTGVGRSTAGITIGHGFTGTLGSIPQRAALTEAAGGFNCVVEISADAARRQFAAFAPSIWVSGAVSENDLRVFLQSAPVFGGDINRLGRGPAITGGRQLILCAVFRPVDLQFDDAAQVTVSCVGDLTVLGPVRRLVGSDVQQFDTWQGVLAEHAEVIATWPATAVLARVGACELTLTAPVQIVTDPDAKQCAAHAVVAEAVAQLSAAPGDAELFLNQFIPTAQNQISARLDGASPVPLTPTISPVGTNPSADLIDEFAAFTVTPAVVGAAPRQALALCLDLATGNVGTMGSVTNFIGEADYGVIVDEHVVQRAFRYGWRKGGFLRVMPFEEVVTVREPPPNGDRDAILRGVLTFDTLELVEFATDADVRDDFIRVGGRATPVAETVQFLDGSTAQPAQLTREGPLHWTLFTTVSMTFQGDPDPMIQALQRRTGADGHRRIACPFAHAPTAAGTVTVTAAWLNAVQRRALFLGNLDEAVR